LNFQPAGVRSNGSRAGLRTNQIYKARPDVNAVVTHARAAADSIQRDQNTDAPDVSPRGVRGTGIPVFEIREGFGSVVASAEARPRRPLLVGCQRVTAVMSRSTRKTDQGPGTRSDSEIGLSPYVADF
jgi:hypothetical protein